jgi:oligoribonuclease NrnB/cAMP/cGMP phosphodiesterase (DHH superfamily)
LDGAGSYIVCQYLGVDFSELCIANYGDFSSSEAQERLFNYNKIIITDFSLATELVLSLLEKNISVTIIDHHDYSKNPENIGLLEIKNDLFTLVYNNESCGTKLTFEYFKKNKRYKKIISQFVNLVDIYDLWKLNSPFREDSENLNRVFYGSLNWRQENKFEFISSYWLNKLNKYEEWFFSDFEKEKIEKAKNIELGELKKSRYYAKKYIDEKGNSFLITVAPKKISFIGMKLLEENLDVKYVAIVNTYEKKWNKISFRSREDFDVTQICNGHAQSGGLEIDPLEATEIYKGKKSFQYKKLEE